MFPRSSWYEVLETLMENFNVKSSFWCLGHINILHYLIKVVRPFEIEFLFLSLNNENAMHFSACKVILIFLLNINKSTFLYLLNKSFKEKSYFNCFRTEVRII